MANRVSIFDPLTERANLWLAAVLALLLFVECLHGEPPGFDTVMFYVAGYALFNVTHVALTFIMLFGFPEIRRWGRTGFRGGSRPAIAVIGVGLAGIFLFGVFARSGFVAPMSWVKYAMIAFVALQAIHGTAQFRGLSSLYNHQSRLSQKLTEEEARKFALHETVEKRLFQVLELQIALFAVFFAFHALSLAAMRAFMTLGLAFGAAIWVNACLFPGARASNKIFYIPRVLFVPLSFVFPSSLWAAGGLHGFEYVAVYGKMRKNSSWSAGRWAGGTLVCLAFAFVGTLYLARYHGFFSDFRPVFLSTLLSLQFVVEFGHYFVDAFLFRFRQPEVREHVAPLLLGTA